MKRIAIVFVIILCLLPRLTCAQESPIRSASGVTVVEADGSPSGRVRNFLFPNGSLSLDGAGNATLSWAAVADITYENLNANGDVGSGATQVAVGNHAHADYILVDGTRAFTGSQSLGDFDITNVGDIAVDSISSDADTSININLGSDAGDDFTVDTNKLVVEGDTGFVGIGTTGPGGKLHLYGTSGNIDQIIEGPNNGQGTNITLSGGAGSWKFGQQNNLFSGAMYFYDTDYRMIMARGGNIGIGTTTPDAQFCQGGGNGSQFCRGYASATVNVTAATSVTIQVNIPTGAKILSSSIQVQTALAAGEVWDAAFNDGANVLAIASAQAVAQWTEHNSLVSNLVTDAETDIVVTKNGGGAFTAQGSLRGIVYYEYQTAQSNS